MGTLTDEERPGWVTNREVVLLLVAGGLVFAGLTDQYWQAAAGVVLPLAGLYGGELRKRRNARRAEASS